MQPAATSSWAKSPAAGWAPSSRRAILGSAGSWRSKILLDRHRDRIDLVDRFVEEAQICGQLQHPGVVPVYELGMLADDRPFFTMKLVKGRTLAALLEERIEPDLPQFLTIFEAVCQTVAYAHARGVIHRDLKPSNVMVGSFGEVQVMDWGLAKVLPREGQAAPKEPELPSQTVVATLRSTGDSDLSQAGSVLGTPAYMAPEQARGDISAIDRRADVFALGSILCEILTGEPAFTGVAVREMLAVACRGETAGALARLAACQADAELLDMAHDCLAADRNDRPPDAGAVASRMTAYLAGVQERLRGRAGPRRGNGPRRRGRSQGCRRTPGPPSHRCTGRHRRSRHGSGRGYLAVDRTAATRAVAPGDRPRQHGPP